MNMIIQLHEVFAYFETASEMSDKNFRITCPAMSGNATSINNFVNTSLWLLLYSCSSYY